MKANWASLQALGSYVLAQDREFLRAYYAGMLTDPFRLAGTLVAFAFFLVLFSMGAAISILQFRFFLLRRRIKAQVEAEGGDYEALEAQAHAEWLRSQAPHAEHPR